MLIAEYDYDLDIEVQREEAFEEGEKSILKKQIIKKLAKGKSLPVIAEELEETPDAIQALIERENLLAT